MSRDTACFSMYSLMSIRTMASSESNMNSASARASSVLPTPVGEALLELRDLAVAQLGRALEVGLALGALGLAVRLLEALLDLASLRDGLLLALPHSLHGGRGLAQLGQLALDRLAAGGRRLVLLLRQGLVLDLELHHPALDLVDLGRERVDLDAQPG